MRPLDDKRLIPWLALLVLSALAVAFLYPRVFPYRPAEWRIDRQQASDLAFEWLRELGPLPEPSYRVVTLEHDPGLELRLARSDRRDRGAWEHSRIGRAVHYWMVHVYEAGASSREWSYQAAIAFDGTVLGLLRGVAFDHANPRRLTPREARLAAAEFLERLGIDLADYRAPVDRTIERGARTDLYLRYLDRESYLGERLQYGLEVRFAGDELAGFYFWTDDPEARSIAEPLRQTTLLETLWVFVVFVLLPFAAVAFVRRYHEGRVAVRRGVQILGLVFSSLVVVLLLAGAADAESVSFAELSRVQMTWVWITIQAVIYVPAIALLAFIGWSLGESYSDADWRARLATFDALFRGALANGAVASSALRGTALGVALAALLLLAARGLAALGAAPLSGNLWGPWWEQSAVPGITLLLVALAYTLAYGLFGYLLLLLRATRRFGRPLGAVLVALFGALLFLPMLQLLPPSASLPLWLLEAGFLVAVLLRWDLLTLLLASLVANVTLRALPLIDAVDPGLQLQGWLAVGLAAGPLWASARWLGSPRGIEYVWDEMPPHVRRIAERERQRVELETARRIQSSILPELPARIGAVELAYRYLPASEVGGDFYDVLPLEDGRLAVAIGDVAGHGVSSGLVMSMARSALQVQVRHRPDVEAVFDALNRVVWESAQRRLLSTLCYAVIDPGSRELTWASAGHLYPYRVSPEGEVRALESTAYPLGVRERLEIEMRRVRLDPGDALFFSSDGLVEASPPGWDEPFGFERLEESLARHAHRRAEGLMAGVLEDLDLFLGGDAESGSVVRQDDLTVLVLVLPDPGGGRS